ncbi:hypothetical protein HK100_001201 [Physocladia obscura]|uniref:Uncharacterized protein n=1 Tax=Physocladia obscura TaxID=109957 RepID=A0AAD5TA48_9FUNG|nr:hypothetical protein HK100_001201 [Physocladia obscura]
MDANTTSWQWKALETTAMVTSIISITPLFFLIYHIIVYEIPATQTSHLTSTHFHKLVTPYNTILTLIILSTSAIFATEAAIISTLPLNQSTQQKFNIANTLQNFAMAALEYGYMQYSWKRGDVVVKQSLLPFAARFMNSIAKASWFIFFLPAVYSIVPVFIITPNIIGTVAYVLLAMPSFVLLLFDTVLLFAFVRYLRETCLLVSLAEFEEIRLKIISRHGICTVVAIFLADVCFVVGVVAPLDLFQQTLVVYASYYVFPAVVVILLCQKVALHVNKQNEMKTRKIRLLSVTGKTKSISQKRSLLATSTKYEIKL